ncbi:MAG: aspartyl/glutamyl-tRNA amidotransferase subunit B [Lentisphaerae bacterium GWF2_45_14]|nr:MAG: aspartyl/glutamyl-tRNA amidotransferase subunit B [Lentisphaerae bacterium GWF2_45_14]
MSKYEAVIGLEVHVQVKTGSKMFCSCPNSYGEGPNTMVCPVCMGYPGVMPVANKEAIRRTIIAGLMCSCEIPKYSKFDRKSYFYPDMPKNYQISQYDLPFCLKGKIHISGKGFSGNELPNKDIGITRIHLEEDVAKSTHFPGASGIDFNRAGVPLMEIVSEPEMKSADEAYAYLTSLKQIMQYAGISDCDMEKGQMRCDVNISIMPCGADTFGTKVELKNLNSFRAVHRSIEYEISRQEDAVENGIKICQETRGWNDDQGETYLMRSKENAHDYRYFPEPDLMPIEFTNEDIEKFGKEIPELPEAKRERFVAKFGLTPYDAHVLTLEKSYADYFEEGIKHTNTPKLLANWIISELLRELAASNTSINECGISPKNLGAMIELINNDTISGKIAKTVFSEMFTSGKAPEEIVEEKGLVQVTDESAIESFVEQAIRENQTQVEQYKSGNNPKVLQFFVGQVMKLSKGKANPQTVVKLLQKNLGSI